LEIVETQTLEEANSTQCGRRGTQPSNDQFGLIQDNPAANVPKVEPNLLRAGVGATSAMKIMGTPQNARYNTIEPEDLRRAVSQLARYQANSVITAEPVASGLATV